MELFLTELPEDVVRYLLKEFLVCFIIARREAEEVEPYYKMIEEKGLSQFETMGESITRLVTKELILDKRIKDGRHVKYRRVLETLCEVSPLYAWDHLLIKRGLEWNSILILEPFIESFPGTIWPEMNAFLERLCTGDDYSKDDLSLMMEKYPSSIITMILKHCHESALLLFCNHLNSSLNGTIFSEHLRSGSLSLLQKHRVLLGKYFFIV
jgi:hypothetical protein